MLVYDVTNEGSFNNLNYWLQLINEHAASDVKKIILGNKCDMEEHRKISKIQGENLANENNFKFFETSARLNTNIIEAFLTLAEDILKLDDSILIQTFIKNNQIWK